MLPRFSPRRPLRGRREGVFLVDKIDHLDRPVAAQLDGSLARLGLPSVDLLVFHAVKDVASWERLAARGGKGAVWWNPGPPPSR